MESTKSATSPQKQRKSRMPRCCIPGCKATNTSTHYFPKDLYRCAQWVKFVRCLKPAFTLTPWSVICGAHFEMKCFTHNFELEEKMGCQRMRRNLTDEAVPTLAASAGASDASSTGDGVAPIDLKEPIENLKSTLLQAEKVHIRKIAPKKPKATNILLKGKVLGPFSQSQAPLLLLPRGSALSNPLPVSTTISTKLAVALPVSGSQNGQLPQKIVIKKPAKLAGRKASSVSKQIIVKKKVVPKQNIIPMPDNKGMETPAKSIYNLKQLNAMTSNELVRLFSSRVKISDSSNYALRCRMGRNCPFVISCPSEYDCRSVMNLHLKKHLDWWTVGTAGNPVISSQLTFESVSPTQESKPLPEKKPDTLNSSGGNSGVPCISETTTKEPARNQVLQSAFQKLCETIAAEMNQIKDEKDRIEALLNDEAAHEKGQLEEKKNEPASTFQSPRKYLIPEKKLKILKEKEESGTDVDMVLRPLERLTTVPRILSRSKKATSAEEPGMPVITAVRGSVKQDERDDEMYRKIRDSINLNPRSPRGPSPLVIANEMIAKAKAAFDRMKSSEVSEITSTAEQVAALAPNPFVSPSPEVTGKTILGPPKLSKLAKEALLVLPTNNETVALMSYPDKDKQSGVQGHIESDPMSSEDNDSENLKARANGNASERTGILPSRALAEEGIASELEIVDASLPFCAKKERFFLMLGLQRILPRKEILGTKPQFRTRLQKKTAVLEKFYKKRHAAMAPKRVEVKLKAVKVEPPDEISGSVFENQISNKEDSVMEEHSSDSTPLPPHVPAMSEPTAPKSLLTQLKEKMKSNVHKGFCSAKGYQLRRAELLKRRARDQTKRINVKREYAAESVNDEQDDDEWQDVHVDDSGSEDENEEAEEESQLVFATAQVIRMPEERMVEVHKENIKLLRELEEDDAERKMELQIRLLRRRREKLMEERLKRESEERKLKEIQRSSVPVTELLSPDKIVLRRKPISIPSRVLQSKTNRRVQDSSSRQIVVDGKVITIKQEKVVDSDDSDVESYDEGGESSDDDLQPPQKKKKLSMALHPQRRSNADPSDISFSVDDKADDNFDSTDSEEAESQKGSDNEDLNEEELDLDLELTVDTSLPPEKIGSGQSAETIPEETGHVSTVDRSLDIADQELSRKKCTANSSKSDRPDLPKRANYADPAALTESELKTRERALEYLRRLKILERQRNHMFDAGEIVPERDTTLLTCQICGRVFTTLGSIYYHYRSHAGVKPFRCDLCYKSFTRLHSLNYHIMIHADKTRFQCKYCGKGFRHPSHYKEHLNKHTGEEPFKCRECSRRFRTSNSLRRHLRKQHGLRMTVRIGDHMPTIEELEREQSLQPPPSSPDMQSLSPPLPESPPNFGTMTSKSFNAEGMKPIRLTLFPKNGFSRVCFADDVSGSEK